MNSKRVDMLPIRDDSKIFFREIFLFKRKPTDSKREVSIRKFISKIISMYTIILSPSILYYWYNEFFVEKKQVIITC